MFFFKTAPLALTWPELRAKLGYDINYKGPIGQVQRISTERVRQAGGEVELLQWIKRHAAEGLLPDYCAAPQWGRVEEGHRGYEIQKGHDAILTASVQDEPRLTDNSETYTASERMLPRSEAFRRDIKALYGEQCAICSLAVKGPQGEPEVEAAHIYPKRKRGGDDYRNGLCLCRRHHWAFDIGWIALSDSRQVIVKEGLPTTSDYDFIRQHAGQPIRSPRITQFAPHPLYMGAHRELYGF